MSGNSRGWCRSTPPRRSGAGRRCTGLATSSSSTRTRRALPSGDRFVVTDPASVPVSEAGKFSLYRPEKIALAAGDVIRFTGTVKTMDGGSSAEKRHGEDRCRIHRRRQLRLDNGWVVSKDAGHFRHGFVETSFGSQGRTVQRVILGMSTWSLPATNQEQLYVSASGRRNGCGFTPTTRRKSARRPVKRSRKARCAGPGGPASRTETQAVAFGAAAEAHDAAASARRLRAHAGRAGSGAAMVLGGAARTRRRPGHRRRIATV